MGVIGAYYKTIQTQRPDLHTYALVDGLLYQHYSGTFLQLEAGCQALFNGTADAALYQAGPWLFDLRQQPQRLTEFEQLEPLIPAVSWLISSAPLEALALMLQWRLEAQLPNQQTSLLRFYDPRILYRLSHVLTAEQKADFLQPVQAWYILHQGQRVIIKES